MAAAESRVYGLLLRHWWLALLVMGVSFVLFGLASLNLLALLQANLRFLFEHGVDAVRDGALRQLIELLASGYAAAAFYVMFKVCEKALVARVTHRNED